MKKIKVRLTEEAGRSVSKLHPQNKRLIRFVLDDLKKNPFAGHDLHGELSGFRSYRIKRYRIIYKISEELNTIEVYYIGHRRDIYEKFRALLDALKD